MKKEKGRDGLGHKSVANRHKPISRYTHKINYNGLIMGISLFWLQVYTKQVNPCPAPLYQVYDGY